MRNYLAAAFAVFLGALAPWSRAQSALSTVSAGAEVSGEIHLLEGKPAKPVKDASGVAIWLVANDPGDSPAPLHTGQKTYRMVQRDKQFHPHLLVVPLGSLVVFPNFDPWFHNVFSLYRGKRFDLGLYEAGAQKAVRFNRLGPSYIFCNIHPQMMAVILTVNTDFYGISDKAGHWTISGVPPGRYQLRVFYEDASPAALHSLDRVVEVEGKGAVLAALALRVTPHNWMDHPNLYGRPYDPGSLAPVY